MKRLFFLLIAAGGAASANAQTTTPSYKTDQMLSRWVFDVNLLGGGASQTFTTANTSANYLSTSNTNTGVQKYNNGYSYGADAQIGFFVGKKRHFGIGAGAMYMEQHGNATLDNYSVEYMAYDGAGNVYRQSVTGYNIKEDIISSMVNIPVVLKYKNRFSKHWGFAADAGAVINLQMKNAYTTHASFDYEASYKFVQNENGTTSSVYDNSNTPSPNDWLITKAEFLKNNPNGNVEEYFAAKRALGFSVGDNMAPRTTKGNTSYTQGSVGLLLQPSFNYFLSDNVALNLGLYYMFQPFKNNAQNGYRVTDGIGNYSSVLNNVASSTNQSYGLNIGARFFLGHKREPLVITSIEQKQPTQCGVCDGSIALHGLLPNQPITVNYSVNGGKPVQYTSMVQADGQVKIPNLCAGNYAGIDAKIRKQNAAGKPVVLADPNLVISSQVPSSPTAQGLCNGSVQFNGLPAGKQATISYNFNGNAQAAFSGTVKSDNSLTISNLCEGSYTGIVVSVSKCSINGTDFTLAAPLPPTPPTPPQPAPVEQKIDISTPILFEFNKSTIHPVSYPVLEEAAHEMNEDKSKTIVVNGYTDIVGSSKYNDSLSVRRAYAVKKHLVKMGASPRKIKVVGHGKKSPVGDNSTYEGRAENRRATMK